jgi:hypothetical protein
MARAVDGHVFLFSAGPAANVLAAWMHRANPRNWYIDVGGTLDVFLSGQQTRVFHEEGRWADAGGSLQNGQTCTQTRWALTSRCMVEPAPPP